MIGWSNDDGVKATLARHTSLATALAEISAMQGFTVTGAALRNRFLRLGLGPPTSYLAAELPSLFDDGDDEVTSPDLAYSFKDPGPDVPRVSDVERILICPDAHHPYVDKDAWRLFLAAARHFKPHRLIVLGDFCDHNCTSQHAKDPNRPALVEYEIDAANAALDELDELGAEQKHFLQGNHCENLERYLMSNAPALFNMITTKSLLRLDERGWQFTPYRRGGTTHLQVGKVYYCHDAGVGGETAHVKSRNAYGHSVVHGHTHQAAVQYSGNMLGERHVGIMSGWLGDASRADYASDIQKRHWQHAFTIGYMEPSGATHLQLIPIIGGKCIVSGKLVSA